MSQLAPGRAGRQGRAASPSTVLLHRLSALSPLSDAEAELVRHVAAAPPRQHSARSTICAEGAACPPRFVVSGWACRQRVLADGRRQIVSFLLPGDPVGPLLRPHLASPCATVALTQVETVDGAAFGELADDPATPNPGIARALRLTERLGEVLLRDQIVRLGRQTAYERVLHLLLELRDRLLAAGLGEADRYPLPLTQEVLADALGLSVVHVNRTLKQVRGDGLAELKGGTALLLKPGLIEAATDWQPPPRPVD